MQICEMAINDEKREDSNLLGSEAQSKKMHFNTVRC